ncbi:methanogenesis marker 5 protein [Methanocella sp. CWC-04]|uniref:Methanogenesis marker 5 protein n=1 Tax=Methanooceanicella nereidis TaxID=2052831 RepID=A0AAP2W6X0_9EURY|nr:methanogenesis marker 5 protein [Methanocella sp. CWC-04]MCD1295752.1 methanogenesis marker 5 protein [Methanocella sp. CWC-04]
MKVFIYPTNSLILSDLVERFGHEPLALMTEIRKKVNTPGLDSPPLNVTPDDPKKGLKWAAIEIPSGVRGRMAIVDPLIEQAEAAIIIEDAEYMFGCMGCARTNELIKYVVRMKDIPVLELKYPKSENDAKNLVLQVKEFLDKLMKQEKEKARAEEE